MLVQHNGKGPLGIGHPNPELAEGKNGWKPGKKINTKVTVCVPGVNRLDDKFWGTIKNNPQIKRMLEPDEEDGRSMLLVVTEKTGDTKKAKELGQHPDLMLETDEMTEKVVRRCLNKPLLEEWRKTDSRPMIQYACMEQLEKLKITPSKKD